jgi:hypothetical protein
MDFQEAFLELFWAPWAYLLALYTAASIAVALWHIVATGLRRPWARWRFAGKSGRIKGGLSD